MKEIEVPNNLMFRPSSTSILSKVEGLTFRPPKQYPMGGDFIMAEPGNGDIKISGNPVNPNPQNPEISGSASLNPDKPKASVPHSPEEKGKIAEVGEALKKISETPEFEIQTQKQAEETPEQETVGERRKESGGVKAFAQLKTIDTLGVFDPALRRTALRFNRRLGRGLMADQDIEQTIKDFESRLAESTIQENERTFVGGAINQLETELVARRELQRIQYEERERYGSLYGERKLDPDEREIIKNGDNTQEIDRLFNRMFDRVDSNPREEFGAAFGTPGQLEYEEFIRTLNDVVTDEQATRQQKDSARQLVRRYSEEKKVRQITHDVNYAVISGIGTEKLAGFIQGFDSSQGDLAFSKKGVVSAFHFYEQALLKIKAENGGFLPEYEVIGDPKSGTIGKAERLARQYLDAQVGDTMADWEKNRAISLARGMGIITARFIEIAASSILPGKKADGTVNVGERFVSMYAQDVIRDIAPFRHLIYKFDIGKERNRVFAFLLNRKNSPWTKEELESFKWDKMIDVLNGLMDDNEERQLSVLNPNQVGGILSRTTWRLGENPTTGALGDFLKENPDNANWIGTGVQIELSRGSLKNKKDLDEIKDPVERDNARKGSENAEQKIRASLQKAADIQPLKLFYNLPDLQKEVLGNRNLKEDVQLQDDLDKLVILQEKAFNNKASQLEFEDNEQGRRLREFSERVRNNFVTARGGRSKMDQFVENLRDREWKLPFNFGTEDVPFDEYKFAKAGGTAIARRWRDILSAKKSVDGTMKLVSNMDSFKSPADIVPVFREIYGGIAGYDEDLARKITQKNAEGVIRFYSKDWKSRLPFGIGTLFGLASKGASFAEISFGKGQMAWDELAINEFTRQLRDQGSLTLEGQHKVQGRVGGDKKAVIAAYTRLVLPLISLAIAFYIGKEALEKKQ